jgi:hypothetical protein
LLVLAALGPALGGGTGLPGAGFGGNRCHH